MHCSKCGNLVLENAKFCQACGKPLNEADEKEPGSFSPIHSQEKPTSVKNLSLFLRGNPVAGLLIVLLLGLYAAVIIPAFAGVDFDTTRNGINMGLMSSFVFAYLWKRRNRSGWRGFGVGWFVAILVVGIAGGINGYERGRLEGERTRLESWKAIFIKSGVQSCLVKQRQDPMSKYMTEAQLNEYCNCAMTRVSYLITLEDVGRESNAHLVPAMETASKYCIQMLGKKWGYIE